MSDTITTAGARQLAMLPARQQRLLKRFNEQCEFTRSGYNFSPIFNPVIHRGSGIRGAMLDPNLITGQHWWLEQPTAPVQEAAQELGRRMAQVYVSGTTRTRTVSERGPGRSRSRELVKGWASAKMGSPSPGRPKPYVRREVSRAVRTPIKVGFIQDLSFSMEDLAQVGSNLAWMVAESVHSIRGQVCMTGFGADAWPLVAPGERVPYVVRTAMMGGWHEAGAAYEQLDAALSLADSDGARVLVVLTDGEFSDRYFEHYLDEAMASGVAIIAVSWNGLDCSIALPQGAVELHLCEHDIRSIDTPGAARLLGDMLGDAMCAAIEKAHKQEGAA